MIIVIYMSWDFSSAAPMQKQFDLQLAFNLKVYTISYSRGITFLNMNFSMFKQYPTTRTRHSKNSNTPYCQDSRETLFRGDFFKVYVSSPFLTTMAPPVVIQEEDPLGTQKDRETYLGRHHFNLK